MNLFNNPALFNYVILTLYCLNAARWAFESRWGEAVYWAGAFIITYSVTFLLEH